MTRSSAQVKTAPPLRVSLGDHSYPIHVRPGVLAEAGRLVRGVARSDTCLVISCRRVMRLWGRELTGSLQEAGFQLTATLVPDGEQAKSLCQAERLYDAMLEARLDRWSLVVGFGGGVVGDLAGFVAATYQRGIDFVQIPTTLLAQVDASVGGKTAVNHPRAKNMIGAFHQPRLVVIDPTTLGTLSKRQLRCGLAEVVKHGVILDAALFRYLERRTSELLAAEPAALEHVIAASCRLKSRVVAQDEKETGLRAILNYGHTLGHALESAGGGRWLHGEAVSLGMVGASYVARELGRVRTSFVDRQRSLLRALGLPVRTGLFSFAELWERMIHDKKAAHGALRWVLPTGLGKVDLVSEVPTEVVQRAVARLATNR